MSCYFSPGLYSVLSCDFCGLIWSMGKRQEAKNIICELCTENGVGEKWRNSVAQNGKISSAAITPTK